MGNQTLDHSVGTLHSHVNREKVEHQQQTEHQARQPDDMVATFISGRALQRLRGIENTDGRLQLPVSNLASVKDLEPKWIRRLLYIYVFC